MSAKILNAIIENLSRILPYGRDIVDAVVEPAGGRKKWQLTALLKLHLILNDSNGIKQCQGIADPRK